GGRMKDEYGRRFRRYGFEFILHPSAFTLPRNWPCVFFLTRPRCRPLEDPLKRISVRVSPPQRVAAGLPTEPPRRPRSPAVARSGDRPQRVVGTGHNTCSHRGLTRPATGTDAGPTRL